MEIFLPIIMMIATISGLFVGMQASVTTANIDGIAATGANVIMMDNYHLDDTAQELSDQADRIDLIHEHGMKAFAVVYVDHNDTITDTVSFLEDVLPNASADIWQIGNEVDLSGGEEGYYGGWGPGYEDEYAALLAETTPLIKDYYPNSKVVIGLATVTGDEDEWLETFQTYDGDDYIDATGLHIYRTYPYYMYGPSYQQIISDTQSVSSKPVWVTETALLYNGSGSQCLDESLQQAQADFITNAFSDTINRGIPTVMYYGWNPGWKCADMKNNQYAIDSFINLINYYLLHW